MFDLVFGAIVRGCDILAYKPVPDGRISSGVALEIDAAKRAGIPVICLPNDSEILRNRMTGEETRALLRDTGTR